MTYERFKEIWDAQVATCCLAPDVPPPRVPRLIDRMSDHTIDALVRASDGDFSVFDEIEALLSRHDASPHP